MKFVFVFCLLTTSAFASEIYGPVDPCTSVLKKISVKNQELLELSVKISTLRPGEEGINVPEADLHRSFDCESNLSDLALFTKQRESLETDLLNLATERGRVCQRIYPD